MEGKYRHYDRDGITACGTCDTVVISRIDDPEDDYYPYKVEYFDGGGLVETEAISVERLREVMADHRFQHLFPQHLSLPLGV